MKVIELISKLIKGEEVPKKIEYDGVIWYLCINRKDYYSDEALINNYLANCKLSIFINDEIEIIEEEKKIELPEKIAIIPFEVQASEANNFKQVGKALNQIIDYLKYKEDKENE